MGSQLWGTRRRHGPRLRPVCRPGGIGRWPMSTPQLDRLQAHCQRLRLYQVAAELPTLLETAAKKEHSYTEFLDDVLSREVQAKTDKHLAMRLAMARFPFQKTLETFDFKFQPSIDVKLLRELATGRYLHEGENALFLGPPGVG